MPSRQARLIEVWLLICRCGIRLLSDEAAAGDFQPVHVEQVVRRRFAEGDGSGWLSRSSIACGSPTD